MGSLPPANYVCEGYVFTGVCLSTGAGVSVQWGSLSGGIGGSKGGARDARPPGGPNSFIFIQFSAKIRKIIAILGVGAPPWGKSWIRHWGGLCLGGGHCVGGFCPGVSVSRGSLSGRPPCTVTCRQYTSYWNVFLFIRMYSWNTLSGCLIKSSL